MTTDASIPQTRTTPLDINLHKRYWLFTWHAYDAQGGMADFDEAFNTLEEAEASFAPGSDFTRYEGEIFDSQTADRVSEFKDMKWKRVNE